MYALCVHVHAQIPATQVCSALLAIPEEIMPKKKKIDSVQRYLICVHVHS